MEWGQGLLFPSLSDSYLASYPWRHPILHSQAMDSSRRRRRPNSAPNPSPTRPATASVLDNPTTHTSEVFAASPPLFSRVVRHPEHQPLRPRTASTPTTHTAEAGHDMIRDAEFTGHLSVETREEDVLLPGGHHSRNSSMSRLPTSPLARHGTSATDTDITLGRAESGATTPPLHSRLEDVAHSIKKVAVSVFNTPRKNSVSDYLAHPSSSLPPHHTSYHPSFDVEEVQGS